MYHTLIVGAIREETPGVQTLVFDGPPLPYQAGQYLTLLHPQNPALRRSYSLSSAPAVNEQLAITLRRIPNGAFSRYLTDIIRPGDALMTIGAGGFFTLPDAATPYQEVFFFAAGSGITPIYSLLKEVLYARSPLRAVLVYSNRSPEETIFYRELTNLRARFPERLHVEFLFSNHPELARARLYKDRLKQLVRQHSRAPLAETLAYVCGPLDYMRMCLYGLRELQVPLANIRRENFNPATVQPPRSVPPDTAPHTVGLRLGTARYALTVQYPTSILAAAEQHGLTLPYSCRTGICGSCVARCVRGTVWMSTNEVLTEREVAQGLVLTCVGFPGGDDAELQL
ncbi:ferredoxin--NADP reductase [Hymenobacter sp. BT175]|uniref:ferredoxin--NADP reductase n=1 Tax=Hymenobacter translucens TaxID=2886507 RepID=UPI001D0EBF24|nr:ferredoxin--NADP reductase [Hymenobacter translucens]MCC2548613.1 ferredoxin--NADP reductase [Hymenobacter translucens]